MLSQTITETVRAVEVSPESAKPATGTKDGPTGGKSEGWRADLLQLWEGQHEGMRIGFIEKKLDSNLWKDVMSRYDTKGIALADEMVWSRLRALGITDTKVNKVPVPVWHDHVRIRGNSEVKNLPYEGSWGEDKKGLHKFAFNSVEPKMDNADIGEMFMKIQTAAEVESLAFDQGFHRLVKQTDVLSSIGVFRAIQAHVGPLHVNFFEETIARILALYQSFAGGIKGAFSEAFVPVVVAEDKSVAGGRKWSSISRVVSEQLWAGLSADDANALSNAQVKIMSRQMIEPASWAENSFDHDRAFISNADSFEALSFDLVALVQHAIQFPSSKKVRVLALPCFRTEELKSTFKNMGITWSEGTDSIPILPLAYYVYTAVIDKRLPHTRVVVNRADYIAAVRALGVQSVSVGKLLPWKLDEDEDSKLTVSYQVSPWYLRIGALMNMLKRRDLTSRALARWEEERNAIYFYGAIIGDYTGHLISRCVGHESYLSQAYWTRAASEVFVQTMRYWGGWTWNGSNNGTWGALWFKESDLGRKRGNVEDLDELTAYKLKRHVPWRLIIGSVKHPHWNMRQFGEFRRTRNIDTGTRVDLFADKSYWNYRDAINRSVTVTTTSGQTILNCDLKSSDYSRIKFDFTNTWSDKSGAGMLYWMEVPLEVHLSIMEHVCVSLSLANGLVLTMTPVYDETLDDMDADVLLRAGADVLLVGGDYF